MAIRVLMTARTAAERSLDSRWTAVGALRGPTPGLGDKHVVPGLLSTKRREAEDAGAIANGGREAPSGGKIY